MEVVICGMTGSGESFACAIRGDPSGFLVHGDEIMVLASERPVIQTALNVPAEEASMNCNRGQAILITRLERCVWQINRAKEKKACSFERIYFQPGK